MDGLLSHPAAQHRNLGITDFFIPLWFPHLSNHQDLVILFLLSPPVYSSPSLWPATALVQVLVISYFGFCSFITDQMVWLWAPISLIHSPYGSQIPHYHVSSSAVPHCHQDEIKLFTVICNALSDLVSASSPESCLSPTPHTPTNPPAFLDIIHLLRLSSYSLQPHIWSPCRYMNMPVPFTSGTFPLAFFLPGKFFHARESQGLFSSWLSAFYSTISLKPFPTALFKNVGYVSQLPQTPPPPLLFFYPLHFSPSVILCILSIFCISCS